MGKVLSLVIGVLCFVVGILMAAIHFGVVLRFVYGGLAILFILVGLGVLFFSISEMRAGPEEPPAVETPAPPTGSGGESGAG